MKALSTVFCAFGAALGLAISASAGTVTIPWDASADPLPATLGDAETGLLEFTYADGKVKTLTATPVDGGSIVLTGDAISFAASVTNTMAAAGGGITLGVGATLSFADSSGATWTGAATDRVVITGFAEKSIRFGATKEGLTTAQRVRLRTSDNKRLWLDAEGYLTLTGPGSRLIVR